MNQDQLARHPEVRVGSLTLRPDQGVVINAAGETRPLQPQVMRVFLTLVERGGATLSKLDLREACWDGRIVGDDAMERVIARIRRVNAELGPAFTLETVPKVGYRLIFDAPPPAVEPAPVKRSGISRRTLVAGSALTVGAAGLGLWAKHERGGEEVAATPFRIAWSPIRGGGAPGDAALAGAISSALQAAVGRVDGVIAVPAAAAADLRVGGDVVTQGDRHELVLALHGNDGAVRAAPRIAWLGPNIPDAASEPLVVAVVGLVGPERSGPRHAPYTRDPVAVRDIGAAEVGLDRVRELLMTGDPQAAHALADTAAALVARTLALDPSDPGALVAAAALARNGWGRDAQAAGLTAQQRVERARGLLHRALLADPNWPPALAALADIYRRYDLRWAAAERMLRRALASDPDLVGAHWSYAYMLATLGRAREGLAHARATASIGRALLWRRLALPRLLYLVGRRAEALALYDREVERLPRNVFLLRELYLTHLAEGDAQALRRVAERVRAAATNTAPPPLVRLAARCDAAVAALGGAPGALAALVAADVANYDAPAKGPPGTIGGRASIDELFIFALEFAVCGRTGAAVALLDRALAGHSLYWPATLPFGPAQFPAAVRDTREYRALWSADPGLIALVDSRRAAILGGQMAGVRPDGVRVTRVG